LSVRDQLSPLLFTCGKAVRQSENSWEEAVNFSIRAKENGNNVLYRSMRLMAPPLFSIAVQAGLSIDMWILREHTTVAV
ncbi:hypothetical protein STEG23_020210, partial [Scotinomys teguina]